ncbi:MAG: transposase [Nitrososphaerota archaeon]|nr:transposase [Nitrososphaerota archaeon]
MYVGIDVGKDKCRAAIMDHEGHITDEFDFSNDHEGIAHLCSVLTMDDRAVMESTGPYWLNIYDRLEEVHIPPVMLANPLRTRAIASARIKSDEIDARILASLRADLIPESHVPSKGMSEGDTVPGEAQAFHSKGEDDGKEQGSRHRGQERSEARFLGHLREGGDTVAEEAGAAVVDGQADAEQSPDTRRELERTDSKGG